MNQRLIGFAKPRGAVISGDSNYRYLLWRTWDLKGPRLFIISLNPSTADDRADDPTLRRCISLAQASGFGGIILGNLFALRAQNPRVLYTVSDPVGRDNDQWLDDMIHQTHKIAVAWGDRGGYLGRSSEVISRIANPYCFGMNRTGEPKHPLYLPKNTPLVRYLAR